MLPNLPKHPEYFVVSVNKLERLASEYSSRPSSHPSNEQAFKDIKNEISESTRLASNNLTLHKDYIDKLAGRSKGEIVRAKTAVEKAKTGSAADKQTALQTISAVVETLNQIAEAAQARDKVFNDSWKAILTFELTIYHQDDGYTPGRDAGAYSRSIA